MFSTDHNSDRRVATPGLASRPESLILPARALAHHPAANSNRQSLARLEFAVTPTKQRHELSSNRHIWAVRTLSLSRCPRPRSDPSRSSTRPNFYSEHTNSRIPANSLKTNETCHFYYEQMNTFRNCSAPALTVYPASPTMKLVPQRKRRSRQRFPFPFWISRALIA